MRWKNFDVSANVSLLFGEVPYQQRFRAARDAGFSSVETWWPFDDAEVTRGAVRALVQSVEEAEVRLTGMNFFAGNMAAGDRGIACRAARRDELELSIRTTVTVAEATGCRGFNLLHGQVDQADGQAASRAAAISAYRMAADQIGEHGGVVLVEPLARGLNGNYPLTDHREVLDLIDQVDRNNVAFLLDTFHLAHNGVDLVRVVEETRGRVGHVQLADAPGRAEPGTGDLDWIAFGDALEKSGYRGTVAAEYKPRGLTREGLSWLAAD